MELQFGEDSKQRLSIPKFVLAVFNLIFSLYFLGGEKLCRLERKRYAWLMRKICKQADPC